MSHDAGRGTSVSSCGWSLGWRHADRDQFRPRIAFGEIKLPPGGSVRVEAGAMMATNGDVAMSTSTREEVSSKVCGARWVVKASSSTTSPHRRPGSGGFAAAR